MGKNKNTRKGGRRNGKSLSRMMGSATRMPFNVVLTQAYTAATTVSTPVNRTLDTLINSVATSFEFYRFASLSIQAYPNGQLFDFTYYPNNSGTPVTDNFGNTGLSIMSRVVTAQTSVPITIKVPKQLLYQTPEDWWTTNSQSPLYTQGRIVSATTASYTGSVIFQIRGIVEFKSPSVFGQDLKKEPVPAAINLVSAHGCPCSSCISLNVLPSGVSSLVKAIT